MSSLPLRLKARLRSIIWDYREFFGLSPALKTQSLSVCYTVCLRNTSRVDKEVELVLPCPRETSYQKLLSETEHIPEATHTETERTFGNTYGYWRLAIPPHEERTIAQNVRVRIHPRLQPTHEEESDEERLHASRSSPHIDSTDPKIQAIAKQIQSEAGTCACVVVETINRYVINHLTYGDPIPGLYSANEALTKPAVDCGGFSTLFVALCHACHIPARIVCGFWTKTSHLAMHAWCEAYLPGEGWVAVDPDIEQLRKAGRTQRIGSLGKVGSDRMVYSYGCDLTLSVDGKNYPIDILQTPYLIHPDSEIEMSYTFTTDPV